MNAILVFDPSNDLLFANSNKLFRKRLLRYARTNGLLGGDEDEDDSQDEHDEGDGQDDAYGNSSPLSAASAGRSELGSAAADRSSARSRSRSFAHHGGRSRTGSRRGNSEGGVDHTCEFEDADQKYLEILMLLLTPYVASLRTVTHNDDNIKTQLKQKFSKSQMPIECLQDCQVVYCELNEFVFMHLQEFRQVSSFKMRLMQKRCDWFARLALFLFGHALNGLRPRATTGAQLEGIAQSSNQPVPVPVLRVDQSEILRQLYRVWLMNQFEPEFLLEANERLIIGKDIVNLCQRTLKDLINHLRGLSFESNSQSRPQRQFNLNDNETPVHGLLYSDLKLVSRFSCRNSQSPLSQDDLIFILLLLRAQLDHCNGTQINRYTQVTDDDEYDTFDSSDNNDGSGNLPPQSKHRCKRRGRHQRARRPAAGTSSDNGQFVTIDYNYPSNYAADKRTYRIINGRKRSAPSRYSCCCCCTCSKSKTSSSNKSIASSARRKQRHVRRRRRLPLPDSFTIYLSSSSQSSSAATQIRVPHMIRFVVLTRGLTLVLISELSSAYLSRHFSRLLKLTTELSRDNGANLLSNTDTGTGGSIGGIRLNQLATANECIKAIKSYFNNNYHPSYAFASPSSSSRAPDAAASPSPAFPRLPTHFQSTTCVAAGSDRGRWRRTTTTTTTTNQLDKEKDDDERDLNKTTTRRRCDIDDYGRVVTCGGSMNDDEQYVVEDDDDGDAEERDRGGDYYGDKADEEARRRRNEALIRNEEERQIENRRKSSSSFLSLLLDRCVAPLKVVNSNSNSNQNNSNNKIENENENRKSVRSVRKNVILRPAETEAEADGDAANCCAGGRDKRQVATAAVPAAVSSPAPGYNVSVAHKLASTTTASTTTTTAAAAATRKSPVASGASLFTAGSNKSHRLDSQSAFERYGTATAAPAAGIDAPPTCDGSAESIDAIGERRVWCHLLRRLDDLASDNIQTYMRQTFRLPVSLHQREALLNGTCGVIREAMHSLIMARQLRLLNEPPGGQYVKQQSLLIDESRLFIKEQLGDYMDYLAIKSQCNVTLGAPLTHDMPAVSSFIYIDRTRQQVVLPQLVGSAAGAKLEPPHQTSLQQRQQVQQQSPTASRNTEQAANDHPLRGCCCCCRRRRRGCCWATTAASDSAIETAASAVIDSQAIMEADLTAAVAVAARRIGTCTCRCRSSAAAAAANRQTFAPLDASSDLDYDGNSIDDDLSSSSGSGGDNESSASRGLADRSCSTDDGDNISSHLHRTGSGRPHSGTGGGRSSATLTATAVAATDAELERQRPNSPDDDADRTHLSGGSTNVSSAVEMSSTADRGATATCGAQTTAQSTPAAATTAEAHLAEGDTNLHPADTTFCPVNPSSEPGGATWPAPCKLSEASMTGDHCQSITSLIERMSSLATSCKAAAVDMINSNSQLVSDTDDDGFVREQQEFIEFTQRQIEQQTYKSLDPNLLKGFVCFIYNRLANGTQSSFTSNDGTYVFSYFLWFKRNSDLIAKPSEQRRIETAKKLSQQYNSLPNVVCDDFFNKYSQSLLGDPDDVHFGKALSQRNRSNSIRTGQQVRKKLVQVECRVKEISKDGKVTTSRLVGVREEEAENDDDYGCSISVNDGRKFGQASGEDDEQREDCPLDLSDTHGENSQQDDEDGSLNDFGTFMHKQVTSTSSADHSLRPNKAKAAKRAKGSMSYPGATGEVRNKDHSAQRKVNCYELFVVHRSNLLVHRSQVATEAERLARRLARLLMQQQ